MQRGTPTPVAYSVERVTANDGEEGEASEGGTDRKDTVADWWYITGPGR